MLLTVFNNPVDVLAEEDEQSDSAVLLSCRSLSLTNTSMSASLSKAAETRASDICTCCIVLSDIELYSYEKNKQDPGNVFLYNFPFIFKKTHFNKFDISKGNCREYPSIVGTGNQKMQFVSK